MFNVGRNEDRRRLAHTAHGFLGDALKSLYPKDLFHHDLDIFCLGLETFWQKRIKVEYLHGAVERRGITFTLQDYIIDYGGTILFASPGQGKSYVALLMAQSINTGEDKLWTVHRRKTLYINLERAADTMVHRIHGVNRALGLRPEEKLGFLNVRGMALADVEQAARRVIRDEGIEVVFLDAISRTTNNSLVEDTTANNVINTLNRLCPCWCAIGHTPRTDDNHIFGSIFFDAGMDIGVKLSSQRVEDGLGVSLQITKANDIRIPRPKAFKLCFDEQEGLTDVRPAAMDDFPELVVGQRLSRVEKVTQFILSQPNARATQEEIATGTGLDRGDISRLLSKGNKFVQAGKEGRQTYWGVAADQ